HTRTHIQYMQCRIYAYTRTHTHTHTHIHTANLLVASHCLCANEVRCVILKPWRGSEEPWRQGFKESLMCRHTHSHTHTHTHISISSPTLSISHTHRHTPT